jgi:hypothetical protein
MNDLVLFRKYIQSLDILELNVFIAFSLLITIGECEELFHILYKKICTHKIQLGVELLCSCILTSKNDSM